MYFSQCEGSYPSATSYFCESGWIVNFDTSFDVTPYREFLSSYKIGDLGTIRIGNSGTSKIVGIGHVVLETNISYTLRLKGVRHVEDVLFNPISTGRLDDESFLSTLGNESSKLSKGSLVVERGKKCFSSVIPR